MQFRPGQSEAIESLLAAIEGGSKTLFLNGEVGSGKTIILTEVAKRLKAEKGWRTYYTTPLVSLVDQIEHDPLLRPVQTLYGKANYPCEEDRRLTAEDGWCMTGKPCERCASTGKVLTLGIEGTQVRRACPVCEGDGVVSDSYLRDCPKRKEGRCEYFHRRSLAMEGDIAVMTMAYFTRTVHPSKPKKEDADGEEDEKEKTFGPRDLLILDEADNLAEIVAQWLAVDLRKEYLRAPEWENWWNSEGFRLLTLPEKSFGDFEKAGLDEYLTGAVAAAEAARAATEGSSRQPGESVLQRYRHIHRMSNAAGKLQAALSDLRSGSGWVLERPNSPQPESILLTPLRSTSYLTRFLWPLAPVRILASGTFLGRGARSLGLPEMGLDPKECFLHIVPPNLPAERAPIIPFAATSLNHKNREEALPLVLKRLERLLSIESARGIVHARSYQNLEAVREHFRSRPEFDRMTFHTSQDRNDTLDAWLRDSRPDSVLVGVNFTRGLDLKDDLARWQVSFKCPFPSLSSRRVRERMAMEDGRTWYDLQALREELQAMGRTMRHPQDYSNSYLLDLSSVRLFETYGNLLPTGLRTRFLAGKRSGRFSPPPLVEAA
jgi:Rad3-related DNA helicase